MPREVIILLPLLTVFWGVNWTIMKVGLEDFDVLTFRAINVSASALGFLLIALAKRRPLIPTTRDFKGLVPAALCNITGWNFFILWGIDHMASGRAAILGYTMPVWATAISVVVANARLSTRQVIGVAIGLAAMMLLLVQDFSIIGQNPMGTASCIVAAFLWGTGTVFIRHYGFSLATSATTAWLMGIGVLPIIIAAVLYGSWDFDAVRWPAGLALAYNCTVAGVFCYYAWYRIASLVPVVVSTVSTLFIPVLGVFSGVVFLDETPGIYEYASLALVVLAVGAVLSRKTPT